MIERHTEGKIQWVDVLLPTDDEIRELLTQYELPPELVADLGAPVPRSSVACVGGVLKVTMSFPIIKRTDIKHPHEIKFIVQKNTLITVRYEDMEAMHQFEKEFEVATTLYKTTKKATAAHLFFALLHKLYATLSSKLDYVETKMEAAQEGIPDAHDKQTVFAISELSRRLVTFRHTLKAHDDLLAAMRGPVGTCFGKNMEGEIDSLFDQYLILMRRVSALFETIEILRETHFALLTSRQNETMKILTIMAFITFPLSLFTSMFGMNTESTPILGTPGDFWIIMMMMSFITLGFFAFFKYKHWM